MSHPIARKLTPEEVRFRAELAPTIRTSDDLSPAVTIVGQSDALEALEAGLRIPLPGYNVFLAGHRGSGRFAAVREMIKQAIPSCAIPKSHLYVHDFATPDTPALVTLPPGRGRAFVTAVDRFRDALRETLPALLGSEPIARVRQRLKDKYERETRGLFAGFDERVSKAGFAVVQGNAPGGALPVTDVFPVVKGEPMPMEQLRAEPAEAGVTPEALVDLEKRRTSLKTELATLVTRHRQLGVRYMKRLKESEARRVAAALKPLFEEIREEFAKHSTAVSPWLDSVRKELLEHLDWFRTDEREGPGNPPPGTPRLEDFLSLVRTNLLSDPEHVEGDRGPCSVIEENYPSWRNLFGGIDASGDPPSASFMDVRAGSILRADGGYLLLAARDLAADARVYENLKRTLRKGLLEIAPREDGHPAPFGMKPAPIPLSVKVILVGEPPIYDALNMADPEFSKIFKIKVEFDEVMPRDPANSDRFLSVLKRIVDEGGFPRFDRAALERLVEEGVRLAGDRHHLSTQFSDLADVMREAAYLASRRATDPVLAGDVEAALDARRRRHGLLERKMLAQLAEGKLLVESDGTRVGQINGLAYYSTSDTCFGMPARISATCAAGRAGVVNIEREAELSGSIHDKGVLILSGFLATTFAQDKPLSLQATIAFEQSYATVDGDSASLAELLALLSALARIPLRQDLAVTGSLNQRGGVQPVGGVTEKIHGFYKACRILGFTGRQGVIIPAQNVGDLHLDLEVVEAIRSDRFHLHAVTDFRPALELMTSTPADPILAACDATLSRYADIVRRYPA